MDFLKTTILSAFFATMLTLASCSKPESFTLTAEIADVGQQGVTMTYYADGVANHVDAIPDEKGVVRFRGKAENPTLVELSLTGSGRLITILVAKNGDKIKCSLSLENPLAAKVTGNDDAQLMADFIADNAAVFGGTDQAKLNALVKEFVLAHPDRVASTALLVSRFEVEGAEMLADSLLNVIEPSARPLNIVEDFNAVMGLRAHDTFKQTVRALHLRGQKDSLYTFLPSNQGFALLAFTGNDNTRRDTIAKALRELAGAYPSARVRVVEISLLPDSAAWRRVAATDSMRWDHTWVPGAVAASQLQNLRIPRTPYFIVADSTGRQLYRTPSVTNATRFLRTKRTS